MPFDGLVLHALTEELSAQIIQLRIEKIYMPEPHELVLGFRNKTQLFISIHSAFPRIHLTSEKFENPSKPPMLCMLLRKHLIGGRILSMHQSGLDRILTINFETTSDFGDKTTKSLILEIMGKHSNAVLVDTESYTIIDAIKRVSPFMSSREIFPGMTYRPLTGDKTNIITYGDQDWNLMCDESQLTIDKHLMSLFEGFSPIIAREICYRAHIDAKQPASALTTAEIDSLISELKKLQSQLKNNVYSPTLYTLEKSNDFHVLPLTCLKGLVEKKPYDTISDLIFNYGSISHQSNRIQQKALYLNKLISTRIEKFYLKLNHLLEDLHRAESAEIFQLYGELITSHLYQAPKASNQIKVMNYYTNEEMIIPLDMMLTPIENAQLYYKKYQKSKKAKLEIQTQMAEAESEIAYLEQVLTLLENARDYVTIDLIGDELKESGYIKKSTQKQKKTMKKPATKPMTFVSSVGDTFYVGRNNLQNDQLTLKDADRNDIWLHTKIIPGSHVIIKTGGKPIDDQTLLEAAQMAATFSKAKNGSRIEVDYTEVKNVKKPSGAKPGMVIYDHYKTLIVDPDLELVERLIRK